MEALDNLLLALDKTNAPMFPDVEAKENYESRVMFAYRRLSAAKHHLNNVLTQTQSENTELKGEIERTTAINKKFVKKRVQLSADSFSAASSLLQQNPYYSHELIAFLSALRSGLDFIAQIAAKHIKGVQADSISTFVKDKKKRPTNDFYDLFDSHKEWILELRKYRDKVIHGFNILAPSGYEIHHKAGQSRGTQYPVLVPSSAPLFALDTRRSRDATDRLPNAVMMTGETREFKSGTDVLTDFEVEYLPGAGYIPIEEFMKNHIQSYETFFAAFLDLIRLSDFKVFGIRSERKTTS